MPMKPAAASGSDQDSFPRPVVVQLPIQQPIDAPLLTFEAAGAYLGTTADGIRAILKGTHKGQESDRELTAVLLAALVVLSERRRYIRKSTLMDYLLKKAHLQPVN
jgi:hypothetical protein